MKKTKMQKGITLIALIITIVILLIIAVVTIGAVRDSGIIGHAQNAASDYTIAQEKEQIGLALSEWQMEKYAGDKPFGEVMTEALSDIATVEENNDGTVTITMNKTGNKYTVTDKGEITPVKIVPVEKGIVLSDTKISVIPGKTKTITASLVGGIEGDISYSSSDENIATVNENGEVTGVAIGTATITAACGNYSATCTVSVNSFELDVRQSNNGNPVYQIKVYIEPIITADMFTEEEAVKIITSNDDFPGDDSVDTAEEVVVIMVNETLKEENPDVNYTDYDTMIADLNNKYGLELSTPQDVIKALSNGTAESIQDLAVGAYNPTEKILKINGKQVTEDDGIKWNEDGTIVLYRVESNGMYEIQLELDERIGIEIIEVTGIEQVGKYVKYDSDDDGSVDDEILYRVLYEDGELGEGYGAQIITADVTEMSTVTLGSSDDEIVESELVEIYDNSNFDFEKALWSYNNIVTTLNKACAKQVKLKPGITTGEVRSVGTNPLNPNQDTDDYIDSSEIKDYSGTWFDNYTGKIKATGDVDSSDLNKISNKNINISSGENYWICSRVFVSPTMGGKAYFGFKTKNGAIASIGRIQEDGSFTMAENINYTYKVRPIVTLEYGVLTKAIENATGLGTEASPFILK